MSDFGDFWCITVTWDVSDIDSKFLFTSYGNYGEAVVSVVLSTLFSFIVSLVILFLKDPNSLAKFVYEENLFGPV